MQHSRRAVLGYGIGLTAAAAAPTIAPRAQPIPFDRDPFTLGIASGYPEPAAVVIWTRLAPEPTAPGGGMPADIVPVDWEVAADDRFRDIVRSGRTYASPDWAHSVHVEVTGLEPARHYWYRFTSGGARSPAGRTLTAPAFDANPGRYRIGLACCQHYESGHYAAYRRIADDALDLVIHVGDYIYENRGIASRVRAHDAPEAYTLDDYRQRYAIYKSDPALQAAHAGTPWILTSDDHEVDNDYAGWHSENDDEAALFLARRAAAYQAYYEHVPMPRPLVPLGPHQRLHTTRRFGTLIDLHMLDGRQHRSPQACGGRRVAPCAGLYDEQRTMLGAAQERWLAATLARSTARWSLLGQQTIFAHMDQLEGPGVGYWADGWSGYPPARQRLVDQIADGAVRNPVILSGDVHGFLINDVHRSPGELDFPLVATEIVTTSISSPGPPQALFDSWKAENPNVRFARSDRRGFTRLTVTPERLEADLVVVDEISKADSPTRNLASFAIEDGRPGAAG